MGPFGHFPSQSLRGGCGSPRIARAMAIVLAVMTAACKPPPETRHDLDKAAIERGSKLVSNVGCNACHAFPGKAWPRNRAGPSLLAFDGGGPIAGALLDADDVSDTVWRITRTGQTSPASNPENPAR